MHDTNDAQFVRATDEPIETAEAPPRAIPATTDVALDTVVMVTAILTAAIVLMWLTNMRRTNSKPRVTPPLVMDTRTSSNRTLEKRVHCKVPLEPIVKPIVVALVDVIETCAAIFDTSSEDPDATVIEVVEIPA